jgi:hypothetical protein
LTIAIPFVTIAISHYFEIQRDAGFPWRDATKGATMNDRPSTYSPAKVKAFFSEFPFLANYIRWEAVDFPRVGRVTSEVLAEEALRDGTPFFFLFSISAHPSPPMNTRIRLLDKEGHLLYEVGAWKNISYRWWKPWTINRFQGETVGDALHQLGERAKDVYYVLWIESWFNVNLVLYKPPKDFTIQAWLKAQLEVEKANLRQEVDAIDSQR